MDGNLRHIEEFLYTLLFIDEGLSNRYRTGKELEDRNRYGAF